MNLVPAVDIEVSDSTLSTLSTNLEIEKDFNIITLPIFIGGGTNPVRRDNVI